MESIYVPTFTDLVATWIPIYLGPALEYFFNNAEINLYDGDIKINLMDLFPMLKQRYALRNTPLILEHLYSRFNGLTKGTNEIISDGLFYAAFNGDIPAEYFMYRNGPNEKFAKVTMQEALDLGLIDDYLNTYQVLQLTYPQDSARPFNPQEFKSYFFQNINSLNYAIVKKETLDESIINAMIEEHTLAREIQETYNKLYELILRENRQLRTQGLPLKGYTEHIDVYKFIQTASAKGYNNIVMKLINHPSVNELITSIILGDVNAVINNLQFIDPRSNKYQAYFMALDTRNDQIIELVKNAITQREFLQREVFENRINPLAGPTNLPQVISRYTQTFI
jgi:hypothetical protein